MNVRSARNWALPLRALPLILCLAHSAVIYWKQSHKSIGYTHFRIIFQSATKFTFWDSYSERDFISLFIQKKFVFFSCLQIMQSHKSFVYIHFRIIQFLVSHQIYIFETAILKGILYLYLNRKNLCFSQWQIMQFNHLQGLNSRNCTATVCFRIIYILYFSINIFKLYIFS